MKSGGHVPITEAQDVDSGIGQGGWVEFAGTYPDLDWLPVAQCAGKPPSTRASRNLTVSL